MSIYRLVNLCTGSTPEVSPRQPAGDTVSEKDWSQEYSPNEMEAIEPKTKKHRVAEESDDDMEDSFDTGNGMCNCLYAPRRV